MKKLLFLLFQICLLCQLNASANGWQSNWYASLRMTGGTGEYLPFWARTGEDGILPVRNSGLMTAGGDILYETDKGFYFSAGANLVGACSMKSILNPEPVYGLVDRAYVSAGWKMLHADLGLKPRHGDLGDLSITGGDIIMSGNARNLPGVNLYSDWIYFEKGKWFAVKGNLAHYYMSDNRFVKGTMVHDKAIAIRIAAGRTVELMAGFHHYAQWGGTGIQASLNDYVKVFFAKRGGEGDTLSDQLNVYGNHLGNEWARLIWRRGTRTYTFQYDKPFEDNSGMCFQNFPDGVWTFQFSSGRTQGLLTDLTCEYINTTWQSGVVHDRPATPEEMAGQDPDSPWYGKVVVGGRDDYFNNSYYYSGWTYYGRMIGLPLMVPMVPGEDGVCRGVMNNRVRGYHIGMKGTIYKVPYTFKATFTENFGTYYHPLSSDLWQLSMALETVLLQNIAKLPVALTVGVYGDVGEFYQKSAGLILKFTYGGSASF
ncbi:MAG: hypothetical protein IKV05_01365 [Bacteroidales bacterium]|nr:hypothetical protein [Bacteroidales bacterium]